MASAQEIEDALTRLRDKLALARALDDEGHASSPGSLGAFGASRHGHVLAAPIAVEELEAFEAAFGGRLPEDYREFLLRMGNGGAGPYYGLAPLAPWDTPETPITDAPLDEDALEHWYAHALPTRAADVRRDFVLDGPFLALELTDERVHRYPPGGAHWFDGCVYLCDAGCGESCFLVVRGARAGEVWIDQSQVAWPIRPVARTFLEWYEHHLDLTLGNAFASAIRRCLVRGEVLTPELLAAVSPIVEANGARARDAPPPRWDEDLELADANEALAFLRIAQGRFRDDGPWRVYVLLARGDVLGALTWLEEQESPGREEHATRARLLHRLGRDGEALAAWDAAIQAALYDPDLPRHKAWLQLELGDRDGAEATLVASSRAHDGDADEAHHAAEWIAEFARTLQGNDAAHFMALAVRLHGEGGT